MAKEFVKSEFADWKQMELTQALYSDLMEQAEHMAAEILNRMEENPKRDMYCKGLIKAIDLVVSWKPEFRKSVKVNPETGQLEESEDAD